MAQKTQPIGFLGRREAIRAPTVEKDATNRIETAKLTALLAGSLESGYSAVKTTVSAMSTTVKTHDDQASQKAVEKVRVTRPPALRRPPPLPATTATRAWAARSA